MTANIESSPENRCSSDRRRKPTSPWAAVFGQGQRIRNRRTREHYQQYFVDRFPFRALAWILLLLTLSIFDAFMTLLLLEQGCEEVNPVMEYLINQGPLSFLVGKYILTAAGIPVLLIFKNHFLFGTKLRVGYMIPIFVTMYLFLFSYQCWLLTC